MDPLLSYLQQDVAQELAGAATSLAVMVQLLGAAHAAAVAGGDPGAAELLTAVETMAAVRDSLHDHAAVLATAGYSSTVGYDVQE
ncbi:hypothetical protein [Actinoplanes sp. URMC 104]|uniref:hypothetical protein n=1 Tax=Actinoplanes sp. URMC 104 TaxID=3423409 RepID=UPI003F19F079